MPFLTVPELRLESSQDLHLLSHVELVYGINHWVRLPRIKWCRKNPSKPTWFNKQQVTVQFINDWGGSNTCKGIDLEDANADICRHLRMLWTLIYKRLHMPSKDEGLPKGSSCRNEHYKPCEKRIPGNERVGLSVPPLLRKRKEDLPFRTL